MENFKGISEPVRVELKPITLLFGANSVGKSTIVQVLHYPGVKLTCFDEVMHSVELIEQETREISESAFAKSG
jgi:predicted ATPase